MAEFEVEISERGTCDVRRDRRHYRYDLDDLDEALTVIRREVGQGVDVDIVEPDGYRRTMRS